MIKSIEIKDDKIEVLQMAAIKSKLSFKEYIDMVVDKHASKLKKKK